MCVRISVGNAVQHRAMDPQAIDIAELPQVFNRLPFDSQDNFEIYRNYVISFCVVFLSKTNWGITCTQLKNQVKNQPEIKWRWLYQRSKVYRLLVIICDAQELLGHFCDTCDCLDRRNRFQRFWKATGRPLWNILKVKFLHRDNWFNDLIC